MQRLVQLPRLAVRFQRSVFHARHLGAVARASAFSTGPTSYDAPRASLSAPPAAQAAKLPAEQFTTLVGKENAAAVALLEKHTLPARLVQRLVTSASSRQETSIIARIFTLACQRNMILPRLSYNEMLRAAILGQDLSLSRAIHAEMRRRLVPPSTNNVYAWIDAVLATTASLDHPETMTVLQELAHWPTALSSRRVYASLLNHAHTPEQIAALVQDMENNNVLSSTLLSTAQQRALLLTEQMPEPPFKLFLALHRAQKRCRLRPDAASSMDIIKVTARHPQLLGTLGYLYRDFRRSQAMVSNPDDLSQLIATVAATVSPARRDTMDKIHIHSGLQTLTMLLLDAQKTGMTLTELEPSARTLLDASLHLSNFAAATAALRLLQPVLQSEAWDEACASTLSALGTRRPRLRTCLPFLELVAETSKEVQSHALNVTQQLCSRITDMHMLPKAAAKLSRFSQLHLSEVVLMRRLTAALAQELSQHGRISCLPVLACSTPAGPDTPWVQATREFALAIRGVADVAMVVQKPIGFQISGDALTFQSLEDVVTHIESQALTTGTSRRAPQRGYFNHSDDVVSSAV